MEADWKAVRARGCQRPDSDKMRVRRIDNLRVILIHDEYVVDALWRVVVVDNGV